MKAKTLVSLVLVVFVLTGLAGCKSRKVPADNQIQKKPIASVTQNMNKPACSECLAGRAIPLRDYLVVEDSNYPEVLAINSSEWDRAKMPQRVIELQSKGYVCCPMPSPSGQAAESSKDADGKSIIKTVRWECQQIYRAYRSLHSSEVDKKVALEKEGFSCQRLSCIDEQGLDSYTWFCSK
jgi:hypothetical protein